MLRTEPRVLPTGQGEAQVLPLPLSICYGDIEMWNHVQPNLNFLFAPEDLLLNQKCLLLA